MLHRPGAVQTEIRIGHVGAPRRIDDFHALSVMGAILGGLFNSRLNMKLREEKGYTYGAGAGFDLRRAAGPFGARAAVNTEVTVPAVADFLAELDRIRDAPVTPSRSCRRPATSSSASSRSGSRRPGPIVGALSGLVVHELPDDELARYRPAIEAVTIEDVQEAARPADLARPDRRSCSSATPTRSAPSSRRPASARSASSATRAGRGGARRRSGGGDRSRRRRTGGADGGRRGPDARRVSGLAEPVASEDDNGR